ncbi:MAG: hypothetical protein IJM51_03710 [Clostridia bacterium]|nr:hypothetical protein [Clostridia bacterium]
MSKAKKKLREDNRIDNWSYLWMAMFTAAGYFLFNVLYSFFGSFVLKIISAVIIVLLIGGLLYSKWKKTDSERKTIYVILFISIILRLCYVIITSGAPMSGTDYELFTDVQTNLTLPETFQPLYYIVAGFIYNGSAMIGFTQPYALDIVRVCTEYMGIVAAIAVYYILCEIEANDTSVYMGTAIIAFHPGLIRLGGEISPLLPMIAVLCLGLMFLTRWNNFTDGFDFIFMSVSFGLATMLHMSVLIFLPVIAVLVIINMVRVLKRKNAANIISSSVQTIGGVGAWAILSFAYPVRNILSGKDPGFSQLIRTPESTADFNTKFLSFSMKELMDVFVSPKDTNAWIYLVKSSVFGNLTQKDVELDIVILRVFIGIAFLSAAISGLSILGSMIARADSKKKVNIWTLITLSACAIAFFIIQNLGSDSAETMDFRVVPVILPLGVLMLCNGIKVLSVKKKLSFVSQIFYLMTTVICFAFCIGCVAYGCWFI